MGNDADILFWVISEVVHLEDKKETWPAWFWQCRMVRWSSKINDVLTGYLKLSNKRLAKIKIESIEEVSQQNFSSVDLCAIRKMLGKKQKEVAQRMGLDQSVFSRMERREDHRISTLTKIIAALGGSIKVIATFGDKSFRVG